MVRSTLLHAARRHLRWLLCFALLLPVAQWASLAHAFTHVADAGNRRAPDTGLQDHACPVCPIAAAVAAGGLASSPSGLPGALAAAAQLPDTPLPAAIPAAPRRPCNRGPPPSFA